MLLSRSFRSKANHEALGEGPGLAAMVPHAGKVHMHLRLFLGFPDNSLLEGLAHLTKSCRSRDILMLISNLNISSFAALLAPAVQNENEMEMWDIFYDYTGFASLQAADSAEQ